MEKGLVQAVDLDLIRTARILAYAAHDGTKRKYSDAPYFVHPERIAKRAEAMGLPDFVVAACYGHDIDEDCEDYYRDLLRLLLPEETVYLIGELTNVSRLHPELPRHKRKEMDRLHLSLASYYAKVLKFLDRIDNIRDMVDADKGFLEKYVGETMLLKNALLEGDPDELLCRLALELKQAVFDTQLAAMRKSLHA